MKEKYEEKITLIRTEAEQNKIAAQLMDSANIGDKLSEMGVQFTMQKL